MMANTNNVCKIYLVLDLNECSFPIYIYYDPDWEPCGEILKKDAEDATLEQLVHLCDHDAEDRNAHDFCGVHRILAATLCRFTGRDKATEIMRFIAYRKGLHGMSGASRHADSYEELGVGKCGCDWRGTFGDNELPGAK